MKSLRQHAVTSAIGAIAFVSLAHANLIINGGFETGDFTGWTLTGSLTGDKVEPQGGSSGAFSAYLGSVGIIDVLSQTFSTQVGATYDVTFRFNGFNGPQQEFDVLFGAPAVVPNSTGLSSYSGLTDLLTLGGPLHNENFGLPVSEENVWQTFEFSAVATSATSELAFASRQDPSFDYLDDVSVTPVDIVVPVPVTTSAVPEPSTYGWIGALALISVAAIRRVRGNSVAGLKA